MKTANPLPISRAIWDYLNTGSEPVAIHAGHFMLVPRGDSCEPTVATGNGAPSSATEQNSLRMALNHFSLETWRMGARLTAHVRSNDRQAELLCLTNDWQYLRERVVPNVAARRREFYASHPSPFPSFREILDEYELCEDAIMELGGWKPFISESWLRRRIERRLKRLATTNTPLAPRLVVEQKPDGTKRLVFDDFGRACCMLVCGQSDCAGEVMELVYLLHEKGYRRLVNIIPAECEIPVNEGTRRAIAAFGFEDFTAMNVAIPCLAPAWLQGENSRFPSISHVSGDRLDDEVVDAVVESVSNIVG